MARMFEPFGHLSTDYYETSVQEHLNARGENRFFVQFLRLVRLSPSRTSLTFSFNVRRQSAELPKEDLLKKNYTNTGRVFVMEMTHWNHRKQRMQETILNPFALSFHGAWVHDVQLTPEHKIVLLPGQSPYNTIATFTFHQDGLRIERTDQDGKPEPVALPISLAAALCRYVARTASGHGGSAAAAGWDGGEVIERVDGAVRPCAEIEPRAGFEQSG